MRTSRRQRDTSSSVHQCTAIKFGRIVISCMSSTPWGMDCIKDLEGIESVARVKLDTLPLMVIRQMLKNLISTVLSRHMRERACRRYVRLRKILLLRNCQLRGPEIVACNGNAKISSISGTCSWRPGHGIKLKYVVISLQLTVTKKGLIII